MKTIHIIITLILSIIIYICIKYDLFIIAYLCQKSRKCMSFYEWICMIQEEFDIQYHYTGYSGHIQEPHIILVNHTNTLFGIGSLTALGGVVVDPCEVVCYKNYTSHVYFIGSLMENILQNDICIDHTKAQDEKFHDMVNGVRNAIHRGINVVMFVDTGDYTKVIRTLNKKVLEEFPHVIKHLFHIKEHGSYNHVHLHSYLPTKNLDTILTYREQIVRNVILDKK